MSFLDLNPVGREALLDRAARTPSTPEGPGMFDGTLSAIPRGLALAVGDGALLAGDALTPVLQRFSRPVDDAFKLGVTDWLEGERQKNHAFMREVMPDPHTTGVVGQLLTGAARMLPEAAVGTVLGGPAGGAAMVGSLVGYSSAQEQAHKGVDSITAMKVGAIEGGTMALGAWLPLSLGASLAVNMAYGAGTNTVLGIAQRGGVHDTLVAGGYPAMAEQYKAFDIQAIAIDTILGAAFGGLGTALEGGRGIRRAEVVPTDIDAALVANSALHIELDTAPGLPTTPAARDAHVQAMNDAVQALTDGKPVDVANLVRDADMAPNPAADAARSDIADTVGAYARELGIDDAIAGLTRMEGEAQARGIEVEPDTVPRGTLGDGESSIQNPVSGTPAEKVAQLQALTAENRERVAAFMADVDAKFRTESTDNVKLPERILEKASRPSILELKPWFDVEHVRDSYRFKTIVPDATDIPAIVAGLKDAGFQVVKADTAKLFAPKEWGFRIAAFDLKAPNGQLIEWYLPVREIEGAKQDGHAIFERWRNRKIAELTPDERNLMAKDMVASRALYDSAWAAYLKRTGQTESAVRASFASLDASAPTTAANSRANESPVRPPTSADQSPPAPRNAENPSSVESTTTLPSTALDTTSIAGSVAKNATPVKALEGREISATIETDRGPATVKGDAAKLIDDAQSRVNALRALLECL